MTPREAETFDQICTLDRDNTEVGDYWIMIEEEDIHLREQAKGESPTASIALPREVFNAFVDWYTQGIVPKTDKRRTSRVAGQD